MQDQSENSLIDPMGDCTASVLNLVLFGRASPYLHNGNMMVEDENGVVKYIALLPSLLMLLTLLMILVSSSSSSFLLLLMLLLL